LVNPGADGGDHARPVAAQNGRQLYIRIETLPYEDVTVIERGGFQSDYGFARAGLRIGRVFNFHIFRRA
jgi:hypothetical protein